MFDIKKISGSDFNVLLRFFFYVILFWAPYSSAVIESSSSVILLLWIIKRIVENLINKKNISVSQFLQTFKPAYSFLNKSIYVFLFVCLLSIATSAFWDYSIGKFLSKTIQWFVLFFIFIEVFKTKKQIFLCLKILIFTTFSVGLDGIYQFITGNDIFMGYKIIPFSKVTASFNTSNDLAAYLTFFTPSILLYIVLSKFKLFGKYVIAICWLVIVIPFFLSGVRAAILGCVLALIWGFFIIQVFFKNNNFLKEIGMIGMVCLIVLTSLTIFKKDLFLKRFETVNWRLGVWTQTVEMIKDRPLFGHGPNTFMSVFQVYRVNDFENPTFAHNCYIQLACEVGIIGLLSFLFIFVELTKQLLLLKSKVANFEINNELIIFALTVFVGIIAFLIQAFFDTSFYSTKLSNLLWIIIAINVILVNLCNNEQSLNFLGEDKCLIKKEH